MRGLLYIFSRCNEMWVRQAGRRSQRRVGTKNDLEWTIAAETLIGLPQKRSRWVNPTTRCSSLQRGNKTSFTETKRTEGEVLVTIFRASMLTLAPVHIYSTIEQKRTQACFSGPSTQNAQLVLGYASHWHGTIFPDSRDGRVSIGKDTGEGLKI